MTPASRRPMFYHPNDPSSLKKTPLLPTPHNEPREEYKFSSVATDDAAEVSLEKKATLTIRTSDEEAILVRDAKLLPRGPFTSLKVDITGAKFSLPER